jgi:hypothetical protein
MVRVKLFLCVIQNHTTKTYTICSNVFSSSSYLVDDAGQLYAPIVLNFQNKTQYLLGTKLKAFKPGTVAFEKGNVCCHCRELNPGSSVIRPVA